MTAYFMYWHSMTPWLHFIAALTHHSWTRSEIYICLSLSLSLSLSPCTLLTAGNWAQYFFCSFIGRVGGLSGRWQPACKWDATISPSLSLTHNYLYTTHFVFLFSCTAGGWKLVKILLLLLHRQSRKSDWWMAVSGQVRGHHISIPFPHS